MAEEKQASFEGLMKQIEEFEKTLRELAANVEALKQKLQANLKKYGSDISKWPKS